MDISSAPDTLRESLRDMTRMQLIRTLAAWRPDVTGYREVAIAYRIALKSLARRYLELHEEIADLDAMIADIVSSEDRRVGKEGVRMCRSRSQPLQKKKQEKYTTQNT